jgi:hypothetical protein
LWRTAATNVSPKNTVGSESFSHPVRRGGGAKIVTTAFTKKPRLCGADVVIAAQGSQALLHTRITLTE